MVDRSKITENVQIGLETVEGTAVPAGTNIQSVSVETKIGGTAEFFRPDGRRFNVLSTNNQEWSTFAITGKATYTEIDYLIAMMLGDVAPSSSGVGIKTRAWTMDSTTVLAPTSATIEKGSAVRAQRIAGALLTDLTMAFSRKTGVTVTGNGIGRLFEDGVTMTAGPADVALVPIVGKHLDLYIDSSAAGLGGTKLLRAFSAELAVTGVLGPIWAIDSTEPSYGGHVDLPPTTSVKLMVEADATGMAYLSQYRADDQMFIRVEGTGAEIESGLPFLFTYDVCAGIKTVSPDDDEDGVTTVSYELEMVNDATWGRALALTSVNDIATL